MRILITKDGATKIPREVANLDEARQFAAQGFHVEEILEEGGTRPLQDDPAPTAEAAVEVPATPKAKPATKAKAPPAKKVSAPAKKSAPVKSAKGAKKR